MLHCFNRGFYVVTNLSRACSPLRGNLTHGKHLGTSSALTSQEKPIKEEKDLLVKDAPKATEEVPEEEFPLSAFHQTQLVPEVPIKGLDIQKHIKKVEKKGSFSADFFTGNYDQDFLTYPDMLESRNENLALKDQAQMVRQLWPQIWDDDRQLQKFNFFNLFQLSVTEMMTVFEAIGASSSIPKTPLDKPSLVTQTIVSLIIRNCLTYWPIYKSDNENVKSLIPNRHIVFGGSTASKEVQLPIGFCWTEKAPDLGSLPPQEWMSQVTYSHAALNHHLISGRKTKVLHEDPTEHYLVFCRDKNLSEKYENENDPDEPNPASDPFTGCSLVKKSELNFSPVYRDSADFKYTDINFDIAIPNDRIVFPAERRDPTAVNIKALGQLATCSVTLGILKDVLRQTYKHLVDSKRGLLSCDIIQRQLALITIKIFSIESMVYYIAGMYDGLEDGFDAHMEASILKIVTNEYAYSVLQEIQQLCGSEMFYISKYQDQINIYDAFLDGSVYNRLYLSTMGIIWFARSNNTSLNMLRLAPWYPGYFAKHMMKEAIERNDWLTLRADIYGSLHHSLKDAATNLEFILKRVKHAAELICMRHGKDVTGAQTALYQLSQLAIDSFMLTTICARASKSYSNGSRHSEIDVGIATTISINLAKKCRTLIDDLQFDGGNVFENRASIINDLNIKMGGYYAESPLDPNV